jgi:hypothetical protein
MPDFDMKLFKGFMQQQSVYILKIVSLKFANRAELLDKLDQLCSFLPKCKHLEELNLSGNHLTAFSLPVLAVALALAIALPISLPCYQIYSSRREQSL